MGRDKHRGGEAIIAGNKRGMSHKLIYSKMVAWETQLKNPGNTNKRSTVMVSVHWLQTGQDQIAR